MAPTARADKIRGCELLAFVEYPYYILSNVPQQLVVVKAVKLNEFRTNPTNASSLRVSANCLDNKNCSPVNALV